MEELTNLSAGELKRKKRFATVVLGVLFGLIVVNAAVAVLKGRFELVGVSAALFAVGLPMMLGLKKVNRELGRRRESTD